MELHLRDGIALVDDEDKDLVSGHEWRSMKVGTRVYVYATIAGRRVYLHRLITGKAPNGRGGGDIDHINGNGLDNRRCNLRLATRSQNSANKPGRSGGTSKFKGVSLDRKTGFWAAHISHERKPRYLGYYATEEDAARAYDHAAFEVFGEFGRLNFPDRLNEPPPERASTLVRPRAITPPSKGASEGRSQGARNGRAKLREEDVREIIEALQRVPRESQKAIGARYGISQGMVGHIANRRAWAHLWPD